TNRISVVADALHDAGEQIAYARMVQRPEPERVEHRDRARAHREDIAQSPADPGRRALIRFDGARAVVRLDLECDSEAVADGDDAGVPAGSLQDIRRLRGERPQYGTRMLVGAVLAPERAHDPELGERRRAAEHLDQPLKLVRR